MADDSALGTERSLKATLLGGVSAPGGNTGLPSVSATLQGTAEVHAAQAVDWGGTLDATIAADVARAAPLGEPADAGTQAGRSTVLPRRTKNVESPELEAGARPRYAHARGILHRDIKPANIQIGPYGEVTVMDWGIAKPIERKEASDAEPLGRTLLESDDRRLLQTQLGSLAGTPLYMSPEQAAGRNGELDERSDVYSLCVLFYEWLVLEHPLRGKNTITEVLAAIISEEYTKRALFEPAHAASVPMEYAWIAVKGLARERERRFQSVTELEDAIKLVLDGHIRVQCHVTFGKRAASGFSNWIDRNALTYTVLFACVSVGLVVALCFGVWRALH